MLDFITQISMLELPENIYVGEVEKEVLQHYDTNNYQEPLVLDFSNVSYIQVSSFIFFIQHIYKREKEGYQTFIKLPSSRDVKIIMYVWRFFEVIEELTQKKISDFLFGEFKEIPQVKYIIEGNEYYLDLRKDYLEGYYKEEQLNSLVNKGFFSMICEPFHAEKQKLLALKKQQRKWESEKLITDVLEKHLMRPGQLGDILANSIIIEFLTNAANHSDSNHFVLGSFYDYTNHNSTSKKKYFTIFLWDNGNSVIKTLSETISKGGKIRSENSYKIAKKLRLYPWFRIVRKYLASANNMDDYMFYDYLPNKESTSEEILLASFLPGITRKPDSKSSPYDSGGGLGLTSALQKVVDYLKGTIYVRTEDFLLEIKPARTGGGEEHNDMLYYKRKLVNKSKEVDFYCKAEIKYIESKNSSPFLGNMITLKIPI